MFFEKDAEVLEKTYPSFLPVSLDDNSLVFICLWMYMTCVYVFGCVFFVFPEGRLLYFPNVRTVCGDVSGCMLITGICTDKSLRFPEGKEKSYFPVVVIFFYLCNDWL